MRTDLIKPVVMRQNSNYWRKERGIKTMRIQLPIVFAIFLAISSAAFGQQLSREQIIQAMEKDGCASLTERKVKICKYDFVADGDTIEAITFQPLAEGKFPGLLLIPGYPGNPLGYLNLGRIFAEKGFACVSIAHPGFGKSKVKPDFIGPNTLKVLMTGFRKFEREPYVDSSRLGIFGYSRGAMAASLLVLQMNEIKAAVLGAGVYDFQKAYDEVKSEGIRENMRNETGMTEAAIKERSSILRINEIVCPVLILHSETDKNVPVNQAYMLRDRLTELKKDFEIKISPTGQHGLIDKNFIDNVIDFFNRRVKNVAEQSP
jgi:dipeptidyl aminopeptidase/acylaminoacyl peptidase